MPQLSLAVIGSTAISHSLYNLDFVTSTVAKAGYKQVITGYATPVFATSGAISLIAMSVLFN